MGINGHFRLGADLEPGQAVWFYKQGGDEPADAWLDADWAVAAERPQVADSRGQLRPLWFRPDDVVWASLGPR